MVRLNANASMTDLARLCRMRPHKVRYALESLLRKQLLKRRIIIDPARAGLSVFGLWFSLSARGKKFRQAIIKWLHSSPQVSYLGEFRGDFEFKVDLIAPEAPDAEKVLAQLEERFAGIFARRTLIITLQTVEFPLRKLAPAALGQVQIGKAGPHFALDATDEKVLYALTSSDQASHALLAHAAGLPLTTFEYRLKRLQERKIVVAYQYWSPPNELTEVGLNSFVHRVSLATAASKYAPKLEAFCRKEPGVYSATLGLGAWQFEICTVSTTIDETELFLERLEKILGEDLLDCTTVPIVAHHKVSGFPLSPVS